MKKDLRYYEKLCKVSTFVAWLAVALGSTVLIMNYVIMGSIEIPVIYLIAGCIEVCRAYYAKRRIKQIKMTKCLKKVESGFQNSLVQGIADLATPVCKKVIDKK